MQEHKAEETTAPRSDVRLGAILKAGIALVVVAALMHVVVWFLYDFLTQQRARSDTGRLPLAPAERVIPPDPVLQVTPADDLRDLRAKEETMLHEYGWVDREKGIVRIPVSRAMQLVLERETK